MISTLETEVGAQGRCSQVQMEVSGGSQLPLQGQMVNLPWSGEAFREGICRMEERCLRTLTFRPWPGEEDLTGSVPGSRPVTPSHPWIWWCVCKLGGRQLAFSLSESWGSPELTWLEDTSLRKTNPRSRTRTEELAVGYVWLAPPQDPRVILPVGNNLGLASQRPLQEGMETSCRALPGSRRRPGRGKGSGRSSQSRTRAGITHRHSDRAINRLGTTASNSVKVHGIKFVRATLFG